MSSQNAYPGPNAARPAARPANQERARQPTWVQPQAQAGQAPQQANGWPQQQAAQVIRAALRSRATVRNRPQQQPAYGQWSELAAGLRGPGCSRRSLIPMRRSSSPTSRRRDRSRFLASLGLSAASSTSLATAPSQRRNGRSAVPIRAASTSAAYAPPAPAPQAMPQAAHGGAGYWRPSSTYETDLSSADWAGPPGGFGHDPYQQAQGAAQLGFRAG